MTIRRVNSSDKNEWARMRNALWPGSAKEHLDEIDTYFSKGEIAIVEAFVLERSNGKLGGFIELRIVNQIIPLFDGLHVALEMW